jgi:argininosuccinate lyase
MSWSPDDIIKHIMKNPSIKEKIYNEQKEGVKYNVMSPTFMLSAGISGIIASNAALKALVEKGIISNDELEKIFQEVKEAISDRFGIDLTDFRI